MNTNNIKKDFIWSSLYTGITGIFSSLMLMISVRINGVTIAGKFIIILTTITLISMIGEYGIGMLQVTDTKRKYTFSDYFISKSLSLIFMVFISIIYLLFKHYEFEELLIFIFLLITKLVDGLSGLYQGELQLQKKLFLASKYAFIRTILCVVVFVIVDIFTKSVVFSSFCMMILNILLFIVFDLFLLQGNKETINKINKNNIKIILKHCFPIFLITMLNMYIINAVKYILDIYEMYELQTYYNIICIIMFALNLLATFLIRPLLEPLSLLFQERNIDNFKKYVIKIVIILFICSFLLEIALFLFGTDIINLVYGVDVSNYKLEMCFMVIGALFYALTTLLQNILTIMRKQKELSFAYIFISAVCLLLTYSIQNITMMKIVWINNTIMLLLLLISSLTFYREIHLLSGKN